MRIEEIKNKIFTIKNLYNLTHGLQLVSIVEMRKLKNLSLSFDPFSKKCVEILMRLIEYQKISDEEFIFFKKRKVKNVLALVFGSDRGFCGNYNKRILEYSFREIEKLKERFNVDVITIGKKTAKFFEKKKYSIKMKFSPIEQFEELSQATKLCETILNLYKKNEYQLILFFGTNYINAFYQAPWTIQILPLDEEKFKNILKEFLGKERVEKPIDYLFEPSFKEICEKLLFQLIEGEIYRAILEARASEEAERMIAMKRAMENAKKLMKKLKLLWFKEKENQITQEVLEISMTKEAM